MKRCREALRKKKPFNILLCTPPQVTASLESITTFGRMVRLVWGSNGFSNTMKILLRLLNRQVHPVPLPFHIWKKSNRTKSSRRRSTTAKQDYLLVVILIKCWRCQGFLWKLSLLITVGVLFILLAENCLIDVGRQTAADLLVLVSIVQLSSDSMTALTKTRSN